jgi:hypothetical protein
MTDRCDECEDGIYPHYGAAPGTTCGFMRMVADIQAGVPEPKYIAGFSDPAPHEEWPPNFHEDPECPGLGVYECPRCYGKDGDR